MSRPEAFANKLRMYLQIISRDKVRYALKTGSLHNSGLHRVPLNIPGYSERVFKKVKKNKTLDVAVSLLIDLSGSMSGSKYKHACIAANLMQHALGNVLHVPVEVLGFSTEYSSEECIEVPQHVIFREFKDRTVSTQDMERYFDQAYRDTMMNNLDGEAVVWAHDRLKVRDEPRKLLVVFSDGSPCAHHSGDLDWHLKSVVKAIHKQGKVEVVGVGLSSPSVTRYYPNNIVIDYPEEIEVKLLNLLKNMIVKGKANV